EARPQARTRENRMTARQSWPGRIPRRRRSPRKPGATARGKSGRSRECNRLQTHCSVGTVLHEQHRMVIVELVELLDAFEVVDRSVPKALPVGNASHNSGSRASAFGRDLHDTATAVGRQQEILAVLLIDDHVKRTVVIAELGDCRSLDVCAGL